MRDRQKRVGVGRVVQAEQEYMVETCSSCQPFKVNFESNKHKHFLVRVRLGLQKRGKIVQELVDRVKEQTEIVGIECGNQSCCWPHWEPLQRQARKLWNEGPRKGVKESGQHGLPCPVRNWGTNGASETSLPVVFWFVWSSEARHGVAVIYLMEWEGAGSMLPTQP